MRRGGPVAILLLAIALLLALTASLLLLFPEALQERKNQISLTHYLALLMALILSGVVLRQRIRPGKWLKYLAAWIGIGAVLLAAYNLRGEALALWRQAVASLVPHQGIEENGVITFLARRDGHFIAEAKADGVTIRFLVDTGASDVILSPSDAKRLGFDLNELSFSRAYRTANGQGFGAPVRLQSVTIGPVVLHDVRAAVNEAPMQNSLLGMSFLGRLSSFEVSGDKLTLRR